MGFVFSSNGVLVDISTLSNDTLLLDIIARG
jgi:hypothetical protein